jgi:hypothetical protein
MLLTQRSWMVRFSAIAILFGASLSASQAQPANKPLQPACATGQQTAGSFLSEATLASRIAPPGKSCSACETKRARRVQECEQRFSSCDPIFGCGPNLPGYAACLAETQQIYENCIANCDRDLLPIY